MNTISKFAISFLAFFVLSFGGRAYAQGLPDVATLFELQKDRVVSVQTEVGRASGFGQLERNPSQMGQGSGFIIDSDGHILTNNHVIQGAQKIRVNLPDGESYDAKLVGADPSTDIAVLKVEIGRSLPAVVLGDSTSVRVGEWVVAIGNPFGLDYSVTAGIISAKGRNIGAGPYDNFIQTDASINPGNSGGPLFNMNGEVIGVNTAIIRGGQGIGFAVPIDMVKALLPQLKASGRVSRGFMGAGIQPLDDALAKSFNLPKKHGVVIGSVADDGPAARAGLQPGDVVTQFNNRRVRETQELLLAVAESPPGRSVGVEYIRDGKKLRGTVRVAERPDERGARMPASQPEPEQGTVDGLGVLVVPVNPQIAGQLNLQPGKGLIVTQVDPTGIGARVFRPGDVILRADNRPVSTPKDLEKAVASAQDVLRFLVQRGGRTIFLAVKVKS